MRTIILSDIHGCYKEVLRALETVKADTKRDRLISLGDLGDRGPDTYDVYVLFDRLKEKMDERCIVLRGNHEEMLLEAFKDTWDKRINYSLWMQNGGQATADSFEENGVPLAEYALWVSSKTQYSYMNTKEGFQCVHADIKNEDPKKNDTDTLLWGRDNLNENRYNGRLTIVGHTPVKEPLFLDGSGKRPIQLSYDRDYILPKSGMIYTDTGCVFGHGLTAMVIENLTFRLFKCPNVTE